MGNPPSLRATRCSGETSSSIKRNKPIVRSFAARLHSGFAQCIFRFLSDTRILISRSDYAAG